MGHGPGAVSKIPAGFLVGAKAVLRAVESATPVRRVIVAADAPPAATEPVRRLAAKGAFPLVVVSSSAELGRRCGLRRPVAAVAELAVGTKVPA